MLVGWGVCLIVICGNFTTGHIPQCETGFFAVRFGTFCDAVCRLLHSGPPQRGGIRLIGLIKRRVNGTYKADGLAERDL